MANKGQPTGPNTSGSTTKAKPVQVAAKPTPAAAKPAPVAAKPAPMPAKPAPVAATPPAPEIAKPVVPAAAIEAIQRSIAPEPKIASAIVNPAPAKVAAPSSSPKTNPATTPVPKPDVVAKTQAAAKILAAPVAKTTEKVANTAKSVATQTAKVVQAAARTVEKDTRTMQTEMKNAAEKTTEQTQAMLGEMNDRAKGMMEKNAKMVEEMNEMAKGNLEAVTESGRIAAKGMEALTQEAAEFGRKSFEQATAAMKSMAAVKSPTELFKLQSDYMRAAFDAYVAEASKTTEHMMKLAGDAAQPLSNRMAIAAEKAKPVA
ncbi:TIGR01841 family phasin [Sphingomonas sp. S1-29]|uniref:phasin family protein n=1 Tax=Sphingomonas sp. S1-29 TaxID=2991074 RepID=UPI002240C842|nr:TIGR01841 family phasin [Sphingomonas sp. S1-29]UZK68326.1 TIGR01841 family phasin [Sphingomonas sp. S1-29]